MNEQTTRRPSRAGGFMTQSCVKFYPEDVEAIYLLRKWAAERRAPIPTISQLVRDGIRLVYEEAFGKDAWMEMAQHVDARTRTAQAGAGPGGDLGEEIDLGQVADELPEITRPAGGLTGRRTGGSTAPVQAGAVACPTCKAQPGQVCRSTAGLKTKHHVSRVNLAACRQGQEAP